MTDVTRLLGSGEPRRPACRRRVVAARVRGIAETRRRAWRPRKPGQTLQATALVHEAYLCLVGDQQFGGRGHFFGAAAEAMRRILVESARRKSRHKRGGDGQKVEWPDDLPAPAAPVEDVLAVDEALDQLAERDSNAAELVKLHYFAGFTLEEAADLLGLPHRTAYRTWSFARAWLFRNLGGEGAGEEKPTVG